MNPVLLSPSSSCLMEEKDPNPVRNNRLLILDWDDTLLPSSWITKFGLRLDLPLVLDGESRAQLYELESSLLAFLSAVPLYGSVFIITNAETGWVELSCAKFFPRLVCILPQFKIISARSNFELFYPDSPLHWKHAAFAKEIASYYNEKNDKDDHQQRQDIRHVISLGDSLHEREAIHLVTKNMTNVNTKSIKFVERPTIIQLQSQIDLVNSYLNHICQHEGNLDLILSESLLDEK